MELAEINEKSAPLVIALLGIRPLCPQCGGEMTDRAKRSYLAGNRVKCGSCDFYGTWRFGTILHGSRLSNAQFLALFFKYSLPDDAPAIAKQLGLDPSTVREWREKIITAVRTHP